MANTIDRKTGEQVIRYRTDLGPSNAAFVASWSTVTVLRSTPGSCNGSQLVTLAPGGGHPIDTSLYKKQSSKYKHAKSKNQNNKLQNTK